MISNFKLKKKQKNKKKKGFTLVELLAVIVILAVIMVITIPTVLGSIGGAKRKSFESAGESIKLYLYNNYKNCKLGNKDVAKFDSDIFNDDCSLKNTNSSTLIKNSGYSTDDIVYVEVNTDENGTFEVEVYSNDSGNFSGAGAYISGEIPPNAPDLSGGLIPVVYDKNKKTENGTGWFVADLSSKWYDYSSQWWANGVSVSNDSREKYIKDEKYITKDINGNPNEILEEDLLAMFVWIPRFSYTIGCADVNRNGTINKAISTSSNPTECLGYKVESASELSTSTPGAIDIKFISKNIKHEPDFNNGDYPVYEYDINNPKIREKKHWYTPPAFWWDESGDGNRDENEELSGIWVGKFQTSVNDESECYNKLSNRGSTYSSTYAEKCKSSNVDVTPRILPNSIILVYQNLYNQFETAKKITSPENIYGLIGDAHVIKNSEWAAVVYLSQSIYGKYGNSLYIENEKAIFKNDSNFYTGRSYGNLCYESGQYSKNGSYKYDNTEVSSGNVVPKHGTGASTTGNIYGIYDMNGGSYGNVMANYSNYESNSGFSSGWLSQSENYKYYDNFRGYYKLFTSKNKYTTGHALYEILGWYNTVGSFSFTSSSPWLNRGDFFNASNIEGVMYGYNNSGTSVVNKGFHTTLIIN